MLEVVARRRQQHIAAGEVAVEHAVAVQVAQRGGHLLRGGEVAQRGGRSAAQHKASARKAAGDDARSSGGGGGGKEGPAANYCRQPLPVRW